MNAAHVATYSGARHVHSARPRTLRGLCMLTKPGITLFIGLSTAAGYLTGGAAIDGAVLVALLAATMAMSGGAAALNQLVEADADRRMRRTARRPIPNGDVTRAQAGWLGVVLSLGGFGLAAGALPVQATLFLVLAHTTYLLVYTPMKRVTPYCTLAGALPGAFPVLAGGAAAAGWPPVATYGLAVVLFTWQIPHFLAIGWLMRDDYGRGGFPMLAVVDASGVSTGRVSVTYAAGMLAAVLLLAASLPAGWLLAVIGLPASAYYVRRAAELRRLGDAATARSLFLASLLVLPIILAALAADLLLLRG